MREYHSPDPIILSVGEEDEVSIADVARHVAGNYSKKKYFLFFLFFCFYFIRQFLNVFINVLDDIDNSLLYSPI